MEAGGDGREWRWVVLSKSGSRKASFMPMSTCSKVEEAASRALE